MAKKEKIPGTRADKPNREQRRHPERAQDAPLSRQTQDVEQESADVESVRAKSSGHGKKTADKWNQ